MNIRPYTPADRESCLSLLRGNVPEHFVASDEADYAAFLDTLPGPYFVVEDGERVIAAGGIALNKDGVTAALCWGIVGAARQREGVGARLLEHRLRAFLPDHPEVTRVLINTTQKVQRFYEKHGFAAVEVRPKAYGPDLDHVLMVRPR